jgi:hypothetical protein
MYNRRKVKTLRDLLKAILDPSLKNDNYQKFKKEVAQRPMNQ